MNNYFLPTVCDILGERVNWMKAMEGDAIRVSSADQTVGSTNILAVGDIQAWSRRGRQIPSDGTVYFAEFHEVTETLLAELAPRLVLSPLLTRNFDCVDLAQRLAKLGYRGPYRAIDIGLPDPRMIVREIRSLVPTLDFEVLRLS
jgi:hypothetical protein